MANINFTVALTARQYIAAAGIARWMGDISGSAGKERENRQCGTT